MRSASKYLTASSKHSEQEERAARIRTSETLEFVLSTLPAEQLVSLVRSAPSLSIRETLSSAWLSHRDSELGAKQQLLASMNVSKDA